MSFKPSKYQQKIYDFITKENGNAVVSAVAGSGKTTTLLNALKLIPTNKTVLFLAFNKSIQKELAERVPNTPNIHVKTVHGFGFGSMTNDYSMEVFSNKYTKLLRDIFNFLETENISLLDEYKFNSDEMSMVYKMQVNWKEEEIENPISYMTRVTKLCDLGRLTLVDLDNTESAIKELVEIANKHNVELVNGECLRAYYLIKLGISYFAKIDFTDMVYLPIKFGVKTKKYDFVFIDECQDLNACQRSLMLKAVKPNGGRFIAVGDPAQAIYGFAGADSDSFKKLTEIQNTTQLPLSVCYRCGKNIISKAQTIIEHILPFEGAKDGKVDYDLNLSHINNADMVLCRQTYPLVRLCLKMLSQGRKARIMGGDIGRSLIKMVEDTKRKREEWSIDNMFNRLYADLEKVAKNIMRQDKCDIEDAKDSQKYTQAKEKVMVIEMLSKNCDYPKNIIDKIDSIFSDNNTEGIVLSTIHKSKGLEADRVFIIHPELMPSKFAEKEWELIQEDNLKYVAYTRAKSLLGFIDKSKFDAWEDADEESKSDTVKSVKDSSFIGKVGEKELLELEILLIKEISNDFGDTYLYEMKDKSGNIFSKFGTINERFILSNHKDIEVGTLVKFNATIKKHQEFRGERKTVISTLSKA